MTTTNTPSSGMLNPLMLPWTDYSLRTLETMMASSQWITQAWQQWFNTLAAFTPLGAQHALRLPTGRTVARQAQAWLSAPGDTVPALQAASRSAAREAQGTVREHAAASGGAKRRGSSGRAKAKTRGSRKTG